MSLFVGQQPKSGLRRCAQQSGDVLFLLPQSAAA
jgi:hypothetical protein